MMKELTIVLTSADGFVGSSCTVLGLSFKIGTVEKREIMMVEVAIMLTAVEGFSTVCS